MKSIYLVVFGLLVIMFVSCGGDDNGETEDAPQNATACTEAGNECKDNRDGKTTCVNKVCTEPATPPAKGTLDGACKEDGTCNEDLKCNTETSTCETEDAPQNATACTEAGNECKDNRDGKTTCVNKVCTEPATPPAKGTLDGACKEDGTCNEDLKCNTETSTCETEDTPQNATACTEAGNECKDNRDGKTTCVNKVCTEPATPPAKGILGGACKEDGTCNEDLKCNTDINKCEENSNSDNVAPTIELNGDAHIIIKKGSTYTDAGATAEDDIDGDVTVTTDGTVNAGILGTYTITYKAIDNAGNEKKKTRTVVVANSIKECDPDDLNICRIKNQDDIKSLNKYDAINGVLIIESNDLTSLAGLENITSVGGLDIKNNAALTSLKGLENITSVGGLYIDNNAALTSLEGLENITSVRWSLDIDNNAALTSLEGLEKITSVGRSLDIKNNAALTSLKGLENITSVGVNLYIDNNAALTSLKGLENITSVGWSLYIDNNAALTSLKGLEKITSVGEDFYVTSNQNLPTLAANKLRDQIEIGGMTEINGNK